MTEVRRHRIVHKTSIGYDRRATASYNELRMTPATEPGQTTLENRLRVRPMTWSHVYRDYWGAHVTAMEAIGDHSSLEVEATSTVERSDSVPLPTGGTWMDLTDPRLLDLQNEYVTNTERTDPGDEIVELAQEARGPRSPRDTAYRVVEVVREHMTYETGVTHVHSGAPAGVGRGSRGVPGLRPRHHRGAAQPRYARSLRLRVPRPQARG